MHLASIFHRVDFVLYNEQENKHTSFMFNRLKFFIFFENVHKEKL